MRSHSERVDKCDRIPSGRVGKYCTEGNFIIYPDYLPTRQVRSHSERVGWANTVPKAISSYILTICPPDKCDRNSIG
ncbi:hypothetical protein [Moorena producens]|uniref:hypothetical protein n=1 Tax=Moorena producens TaxID=1155739 RepID=UPI003C77A027